MNSSRRSEFNYLLTRRSWENINRILARAEIFSREFLFKKQAWISESHYRFAIEIWGKRDKKGQKDYSKESSFFPGNIYVLPNSTSTPSPRTM